MRILGVTVLGLLELLACTRGPTDCAEAGAVSPEERLRLRDAPPIGLGEVEEPPPPDGRCKE